MKYFKSVNVYSVVLFFTFLNTLVFIIVSEVYQNVLDEIEELRKQLESTQTTNCDIEEPRLIYEKKRRRIRSTLQFMWNTLKKKTFEMQNKYRHLKKELSKVLEEVYNHKISILNDLKLMSLNDGYENWRQMEFKNLNKLIQKRFHRLMNPKNCTTAKILICHQTFQCGWGCSTFQYIQSFAHAFGNQKILSFVRLPPISKFYGTDMYNKYYQPISKTCGHVLDHYQYPKWKGKSDSNILPCPIWKKKLFTYQAVPKDLLIKLEKIVEVPSVWFISQIEEFLFKLKPNYAKHIENVAEQIGFKHAIVGVHVRRTDKKKEAGYRPISEYMERVKEFYDVLELTQKVDKRRIFVATDDPSVIKEIITKYSDKYEIITIKNHTLEAENIKTRIRSPLSIMTDVNLLARCDHFVGTFTSNVGRRVFEFMQRTNLNAPEMVSSLDAKYFEYVDLEVKYRVLIKHIARSKKELNVKKGEILKSYDANITSGWIMAYTDGQSGLVPNYKLEEVPKGVNFPKY